jgi:outer membrane protein
MSARLYPFAAGIAAAAMVTMAQSAAATDFTIGLGAGLAPDYEGSEDYEAVPSWVFSANNLYDPATYVSLRGTQLRSNFVPHPQLRAGVSGLFVGERDDVENNRVDDLRSTDAALLLGGGFGWDFFPQPELGLTLAVDLMYDVANSNGGIVQPYLSYFNALPGTPLSVGAELFTTWASEDYMSEQFGISASDSARSGLNRFNADEGFKDAGLRGSVTYRFTDSWSSTFAAQYKRMVDEAADSPVVDDEGNENQFFAGVTVNFHF